MGPMEIKEMVILDDGFRILLFLEERLSSLHDDIGIVVFLDRISQENLLVSAAQGFLRRVFVFGRAGAGSDDAEYRHAEADGHRNS